MFIPLLCVVGGGLCKDLAILAREAGIASWAFVDPGGFGYLTRKITFAKGKRARASSYEGFKLCI